MKGIKRFRQAIKNQQDAGEGEFRLSFADVEAICDECEDDLARLSWADGVPAPVDANGEVVPLTTREMYDDCGRKLKVSMFRHHADPNATQWVAMCANNRGGNGYADVENLHLHRPDSWERLEEDVERYEDRKTFCAYYDRLVGACQGCPAEDKRRHCIDSVARDVMRRAKALAERDAKEAGRG